MGGPGAQAAGAVALFVINTEDAPSGMADPDGEAADIVIPALCIGKADGERLLLGAEGPAGLVAFRYDRAAEKAAEAAAEVAETAAKAEKLEAVRPSSLRPLFCNSSHTVIPCCRPNSS